MCVCVCSTNHLNDCHYQLERLLLPTITNNCGFRHMRHRNFYLFATFFLPFSSTLSTFFSLPGRNLCLSLAFLLSPLAFGFALE